MAGDTAAVSNTAASQNRPRDIQVNSGGASFVYEGDRPRNANMSKATILAIVAPVQGWPAIPTTASVLFILEEQK
jgi:hypothetical protein